MTGRGIDQVLPFPSEPPLHESFVKDAREYVRLAEEANGVIPKPVDFSYVWGDALGEFERFSPDLRLINLETSVTRSGDFWKGKEIHYRMSPENVGCLGAGGVDFCSLANNHVLDWGYAGLDETLETLRLAGVSFSGAGQNVKDACDPAVLDLGSNGRVFVYSFGSLTSGVPLVWAATQVRGGVSLLENSSFDAVKERVKADRRVGDVVVFSVHWGSNWGFDVPFEQQDLAHRLIRDAGVDVVWGHSSHHVKGVEVYLGKLILYGCGDFLNDYEGIGGYEKFRGDLSLMYFVDLNVSSGKLLSLQMVPTQVRRFRVSNVAEGDSLWVQNTLNREGAKFGTGVSRFGDGDLELFFERE